MKAEAIEPSSTPAERVEALCAAVARRVGEDPEEALALAREAGRLAAGSADGVLRGKAARALANALHFTGRSAEAQEQYAAALDLFLASGEASQAAITRSSALLNLAYLGDADTAVDWYGAAREAFDAQGDRQRAAVLEHNYANVLYRQDRWQEALDRYRSAHRELSELGRSLDAAICLRNIAVCRISLEQFDEALAAYEECRGYAAREDLGQLRREADYNVAYLYFLRGEYTRAIDLFTAARADAESAGDAYHAALCDLDLSEIYLELNLLSDTERLARRATDAFAQLGLTYEGAKAATFLALAAGRRGRAEESLAGLAASRATFVTAGNRLWPALVDFYRAVVLTRSGSLAEARSLALAALASFESDGLATRAALCEILLADLELAAGELAAARRRCQAALDRLRDFAPPALEVRALRVLGQIEESSGDLPAALAAYRRAATSLERTWSQLAGDDVKIAYVADKRELFESLVALLVATATPADPGLGERVFATVEAAKSRALHDLLAFRSQPASPSHDTVGTGGGKPVPMGTGGGKPIPHEEQQRPGLLARAAELRRELHWLYHRLDRRPLEAPAPGAARAEVARLERSLREREDELVSVLRGLRTVDPGLAAMAGGAPGVGEVRRALPAGAVLVEYFVARDRLLACVVDEERVTLRHLGPVGPVRALQGLLDFQLTRPRVRPRFAGAREIDAAATRDHLRSLHERLLAPLADCLADRRRLIVVPHGFLHHVPFHALDDGSGPLFERLAVSYAPSAAVYALCVGKCPRWEERSLVVGVADALAPRIADEARAVAAALPASELLLGAEATAERIAAGARTARYVHLATHGLFRRDHPMFSALRLGTTRLLLADLYDLELAAELVVLSGCGTGLHTIQGADELVGLSRGMLYAGAHAVLVSLWEVDDDSTSELMRVFYRHLGAGEGPAAALQETLRELSRSHPDPALWAPFVLIGRS